MTETARYSHSTAQFERAQRSLAGGVSSHFRIGGDPTPLSFARASGARLWDEDGNEYLDYALGMGPTILGHAAPPVIDAVGRSLVSGQLYAGQNDLEVELAEVFQRVVPSAERVRFGLSGSEMVQAALRTARAATGRPTIIKFDGMYHGWLDAAFHAADPTHELAPGVFAPLPMSQGQPFTPSTECLVVRWNDPTAISTAFELAAGSVAGVITEAMCCNTGVLVPSPGYLETLRELCDRHGALLIFDEVITGFRVALGGAQQLFGITPDLAVFAKAMGGGFPIAALVGSGTAMNVLSDGRVVHAGTYNSSVPTVAAALATIDALARDGGATISRIDATGRRLMDGLRAAATAAAVDLHVQGLGAVFNTTFGVARSPLVSIDEYRAADAERQARFLRLLLDRGVRPTSRGTWFVSAAHGDDDVDRTVAAAADALRALAREAE